MTFRNISKPRPSRKAATAVLLGITLFVWFTVYMFQWERLLGIAEAEKLTPDVTPVPDARVLLHHTNQLDESSPGWDVWIDLKHRPDTTSTLVCATLSYVFILLPVKRTLPHRRSYVLTQVQHFTMLAWYQPKCCSDCVGQYGTAQFAHSTSARVEFMNNLITCQDAPNCLPARAIMLGRAEFTVMIPLPRACYNRIYPMIDKQVVSEICYTSRDDLMYYTHAMFILFQYERCLTEDGWTSRESYVPPGVGRLQARRRCIERTTEGAVNLPKLTRCQPQCRRLTMSQVEIGSDPSSAPSFSVSVCEIVIYFNVSSHVPEYQFCISVISDRPGHLCCIQTSDMINDQQLNCNSDSELIHIAPGNLLLVHKECNETGNSISGQVAQLARTLRESTVTSITLRASRGLINEPSLGLTIPFASYNGSTIERLKFNLRLYYVLVSLPLNVHTNNLYVYMRGRGCTERCVCCRACTFWLFLYFIEGDVPCIYESPSRKPRCMLCSGSRCQYNTLLRPSNYVHHVKQTIIVDDTRRPGSTPCPGGCVRRFMYSKRQLLARRNSTESNNMELCKLNGLSRQCLLVYIITHSVRGIEILPECDVSEPTIGWDDVFCEHNEPYYVRVFVVNPECGLVVLSNVSSICDFQLYYAYYVYRIHDMLAMLRHTATNLKVGRLLDPHPYDHTEPHYVRVFVVNPECGLAVLSIVFFIFDSKLSSTYQVYRRHDIPTMLCHFAANLKVAWLLDIRLNQYSGLHHICVGQRCQTRPTHLVATRCTSDRRYSHLLYGDPKGPSWAIKALYDFDCPDLKLQSGVQIY